MKKLSVIDGETLLDMDLNAPRFCVQNLLPQGLSILGGAPKMGRAWLVSVEVSYSLPVTEVTQVTHET